MLKGKQVYTVSAVNRYIKNMLEEDMNLNSIYVEGEISNFKAHTSGHFYFTLKDENGAIDAVMFRRDAEFIRFRPENGTKVVAKGYISLYEKTGKYQIYVQSMEPSGKGSLYLAYEQLKKQLEDMGCFAPEFKKPIPKFPKCVAVVTSPTGAAVRDIIQVTGRRNPNVEIVIRPTLVQGAAAVNDIVNAIHEINEWGGADTIIVGRGGGSIEDLWAFNDIDVARAVFQSQTPIISAVGHETDFTICDFIADMRAPTPSAAGEIAVPEAVSTKDILTGLTKRMDSNVLAKIYQCRTVYNNCIMSRTMRQPLEKINNDEIYVEELLDRLDRCFDNKNEKTALKLSALSDALEKLSPLNIMNKGYSLVYSGKGRLVKKAADVKVGDKIKIRFFDGEIKAEVRE